MTARADNCIGWSVLQTIKIEEKDLVGGPTKGTAR